jgi:hypothetical protein
MLQGRPPLPCSSRVLPPQGYTITLGAPFSPTWFSRRPWAVHNVAMSFGPVEIFFILVVVGLVAYVLWRLLIRPRRMRPPR